MIWQLPVSIISLSLLPSLVIFSYIQIRYKTEDLDRVFFIKLMLWGSVSVIPGVIIVTIATSLMGNGVFSMYLLKPFIAVALIEESLKLIILSLILYRNIHFKTVKQGILYGIAISVGFAFSENILYLTGSSTAYPLIVIRSLTSVPLHGLCGAFIGYYAGVGKTREKQFMGKALVVSVTIHGIYNILVNLHFPYYLLSIFFIIISLRFLIHLYRKSENISRF